MANNCLVTKLKETVQNSNLPILNAVFVDLRNAAVGGNLAITPALGKTVTCIDSDGNTTSISTATQIPVTIGKIYNVLNGEDISAIDGSVFYDILNKNLKISSASATNVSTYRVCGIIESLPVSTSLHVIQILASTVKSKESLIAWLGANTGVTDFDFREGSNVSFTTTELGQLPWNNIGTIIIYETGGGLCSGSIEEFVAAKRKQGVTTGTVSFPYFQNNSITFDGKPLSDYTVDDYKNIVSWTANTIAVNNTTINS